MLIIFYNLQIFILLSKFHEYYSLWPHNLLLIFTNLLAWLIYFVKSSRKVSLLAREFLCEKLIFDKMCVGGYRQWKWSFPGSFWNISLYADRKKDNIIREGRWDLIQIEIWHLYHCYKKKFSNSTSWKLLYCLLSNLHSWLSSCFLNYSARFWNFCHSLQHYQNLIWKN